MMIIEMAYLVSKNENKFLVSILILGWQQNRWFAYRKNHRAREFINFINIKTSV